MFVSVTNYKHDQVMKRKTRLQTVENWDSPCIVLACLSLVFVVAARFSLDEQKTIGVMMHFFNSPSCSDKLKKK